MSLLDPLRDHFQRRQRTKLDASSAGVLLVMQRSEAQRGNFVFPGLDVTAAILYQGEPIGHVRYGVSPLNDRLYISDFQINTEQHRRGFGSAALWCLYRQYGVHLATMHEYGTSLGFWSKIQRRFAAAGVELQRDIRTAEQDEIKASWAHLVPESEVNRSIRKYWEWVAAEHAAGRPAGPGIR